MAAFLKQLSDPELLEVAQRAQRYYLVELQFAVQAGQKVSLDKEVLWPQFIIDECDRRRQERCGSLS